MPEQSSAPPQDDVAGDAQPAVNLDIFASEEDGKPARLFVYSHDLWQRIAQCAEALSLSPETFLAQSLAYSLAEVEQMLREFASSAAVQDIEIAEVRGES